MDGIMDMSVYALICKTNMELEARGFRKAHLLVLNRSQTRHHLGIIEAGAKLFFG